MRDDEFEALLESISGKPRKKVTLVRLALVPIQVERYLEEPDERRYFATSPELPIWLDGPNIREDAERQFYTALMQIQWLKPKVRTAVARALGRSVKQDERAAARLQTMIYRNALAQYKAGFRATMGGRGYAEEAFKKLSRLTGISVEALKQRLRRGRPRRGRPN